jgi:hypothetical protein
MHYSVSTHDDGIEWDDLTLYSAMMVELWTRQREMEDEYGNDVEHKCGDVKSGV